MNIIFFLTIFFSIIEPNNRMFHIFAAVVTVIRIISLKNNNRKNIAITGILNMVSELTIYMSVFNILLIISNIYGLILSIITYFSPNLVRSPKQVKYESIFIIILSVIFYFIFTRNVNILILITSFLMLILLNLGIYLLTVNKSYEVPYILGHICMIIIGYLSNDIILIFMGLSWSISLYFKYINTKKKKSRS